MPLYAAIENLQDLYGFTMLIDSQAFREDLSQDEVGLTQIKLPVMRGIRISVLLRMLSEQVQGAYLVRQDFIEITTPRRARPDLWHGNQVVEGMRPLFPLVYADFENMPLKDALRALSEQADISILIDSRLPNEHAEKRLSACFKNVPLDTAVRLLAEEADLKAVQIDHVFFLTQPKAAHQLEIENKQRRGVDQRAVPAAA